MNNINDVEFNKILDEIINRIKDNEKVFEQLNYEDNKKFIFNFDLNQLIKILEKYSKEQCKQKTQKSIIVNYYGNPYITAMLCIESLINNVKLLIAIEDMCYGINYGLVKIINDILDENGIKSEIILKNKLKKDEISHMEYEEVICLGNLNVYTKYKKLENIKVRNIPLFGINLYYDSYDYRDLVNNIIEYSEKNLYEIQVIGQDEEFDDVIYIMNNSVNNYCSVILSKDKEKIDQFKNEIKANVICVNENPFSKFKMELPKEVWGRRLIFGDGD